MIARARTSRSIDPDHIVGAAEIARRLVNAKTGQPVSRDAVNTWNKRRRAWVAAGSPSRRANEEPMPAPLLKSNGEPVTVSGEPCWNWQEIVAWVQRTGRYRPAGE